MLFVGVSDKVIWNFGCVCVDLLDVVYVNVIKLKVEIMLLGNIDL